MNLLKSNNLFAAFIACIAGLAIAGCGAKTETSFEPTRLPPVDDYSATESQAAISDAMARQFANQWREAIHSGDAQEASELIAWREILERAIDPLNASDSNKRGVVTGALKNVSGISQELMRTVSSGGSYELVSVKRRGGEPYVLFRVLSEDGGYNYNLLRVAKIRGRARADQLFVATTGEEIGDTFRNTLAPGVQSLSGAGRFTGAQKQFLEDMKLQKSMVQAISSGQSNRALEIYDQMPDRLKKDKLPMLYRVMATPVENEQAYSTAVDDYLAAFPGDAAVGLVALDASVLRKDSEMLRQAHQSLTEWTGGDPYLDLIVGANLVVLGKADIALEVSKSADPSTVGLDIAHDYKLAISLAAKDYQSVLEQLRILRDDFGYDFINLEEVEGYEGFVASPQFQEWMEK